MSRPPVPARLGLAAASSLFVALALAPVFASASAATERPGDGDLSPRLAELAKPSVRSLPPARQARLLSLARRGPGSLLRDGDRVLVDVRFERGAVVGVDSLRAAGAKIVHVSRRYQTVTVASRPAGLRDLAAVSGVESVTEVLAPIVSAAACAGLVTSEGDSQLGAPSARSAFNLDGSGVTVGILSDSFDTDAGATTRAPADVASGDLPGPGNPCGRIASVNRLDEYGESDAGDEGRAMAQIVHDLAPGGAIVFATAFKGELSFASNIRALAGAGAGVIVDDVGYLEEPFFQDGPIAVAAKEVASGGVAYLSAAGNSNLIDGVGRDIASWEAAEFRDTGSCPPLLEVIPGLEAANCMDFDPGVEKDPTFEITVSKGATLTVDLQWAEPWNGVMADLDVFLLDNEDKPIPAIGPTPFVGGFDDNPGKVGDGGTQRPVEVFSWTNTAGVERKVRLAINRCFGVSCNPAASETAMPRLKFILLSNGVSSTEYPQSAGGDVVGPTIFGHSGAASAVSVGAVPFNDGSTVEPYSSRGPVTHYFGPVTGTSPAAPLASPQTIPKPDVVATDCGLTTFFLPTETPGIHRFCGTSAAAPHAAAVAALMREANPSLSLAQLRVALAATARPVGAFGVDAVGAGLVDAYGAVSSVALPPKISITEPPPALGRDPQPRIGFAANRPVAFQCAIDGGTPQPCTSPFSSASPLGDGDHGFAVSGTDVAGRTGTSDVATFKIDTRRPRTFFRKRPRKVIRTRHRKARAVFRFRSNEQDVSFVCRVDGGLPRFCPKRFARRYRIGRHVVRVTATDAAGNSDRTPAVYRFRVKRVS